jgi:hypothetical protein
MFACATLTEAECHLADGVGERLRHGARLQAGRAQRVRVIHLVWQGPKWALAAAAY